MLVDPCINGVHTDPQSLSHVCNRPLILGKLRFG
jgi:hypothetical protein